MTQKKVLVIDDDPNILAAFKSFLEKEDCEMIGVGTAGKAREVMNQKVDLIISDLRLGNISSVSLLSDIKNSWPDLPMIIISGYPELIGKEDLKKLGTDYFFQKPLELKKIREAIRKLVKIKS